MCICTITNSQWWSKQLTQLSQTAQCFDRGGRYILHVSHHFHSDSIGLTTTVGPGEFIPKSNRSLEEQGGGSGYNKSFIFKTRYFTHHMHMCDARLSPFVNLSVWKLYRAQSRRITKNSPWKIKIMQLMQPTNIYAYKPIWNE